MEKGGCRVRLPDEVTAEREGGLLRHTVDLPVVLLIVLLQVGGEEDILGLDPLQLLGHLICRAEQVDVLVRYIGRVLVLLAAGEGIDLLPFLGRLGQLLDNLPAEDA